MSSAFLILKFYLVSDPKNSLDVSGVPGVRLQLIPQTPDRIVHGVGA